MDPATPPIGRTPLARFAAAVLGVLGVAYAWTAWLLPAYNSDHLGCDACHHAILIHCQTVADPAERELIAGVMVDYPQMSHALAALSLPLFGDDPYRAMRFASAAAVVLLLVSQLVLLRTAMSLPWALVSLAAWQLVCGVGNLGNVHYFCAAYFFAQAFGMIGVWLALALHTRPAASAGEKLLLGAGSSALAAFAYLCHLVPGVVVFGALGLYSLARLIGRRDALEAVRIALLIAVGALVIFGTSQLALMSRGRGAGGHVPIRHLALLLTWLPTLVVGAALRARQWRRGDDGGWPGAAMDGLLCVLVVAGGLQAVCAVEWLWHGETYLYPVLKFFYLLFPAASLLWFLAAARVAARAAAAVPALGRWREKLDGRGARLATAGVAALLLGVALAPFVRNELRPEPVTPRRHPVAVARQLGLGLRAQGKDRSDLLYYDPALPQSSVYANMVGLHRTLEDSYKLMFGLHGWDPAQGPVPARLRQDVSFSALVLPQTLPLGSAGPLVPREEP